MSLNCRQWQDALGGEADAKLGGNERHAPLAPPVLGVERRNLLLPCLEVCVFFDLWRDQHRMKRPPRKLHQSVLRVCEFRHQIGLRVCEFLEQIGATG